MSKNLFKLVVVAAAVTALFAGNALVQAQEHGTAATPKPAPKDTKAPAEPKDKAPAEPKEKAPAEPKDKAPAAPKDAKDAKPAAAAKAMCVVSDEPIDPSTRLVTDAGVVYFCCSDCVKKYQAEPAKYAEKVAAQQKATGAMPHAQLTCPCGKPFDAKVTADGVHYCSEKCMEAAKAKPAEAKTLASIYTVQTMCPCGKPIDPTAVVEFTTGQKVYVCSAACVDKFKADVAAMHAPLEKMNIHVDAKTLKGK